MQQRSFIQAGELVRKFALGAALLTMMLSGGPALAQSGGAARPDGYLDNNRVPDARFKADILVVVAHPDDETLVTAYLAREVLDHHKRVAVVYGTHGEGSNNQVGAEQAAAMADVRGIEARAALGTLGIRNVWFLTGRDTLSQNVLHSLEHWGHGTCLDELVRIVRLTRPSVILTFLPDFTTGENHADHQAAGVLATEAFDLAGDPTAFPEQVSPAGDPDQNMNLTEGLRVWQPEKIYYFYNPTHDIFAGQGPQFSSDDISPSRHVSYGTLAAEAFAQHRTQGGDNVKRALESHTLSTSQSPDVRMVTAPVKLIFGKSLVPSGVTDDVFAGVVSGGIPYQRVQEAAAAQDTHPSLEIGDPWAFYHRFWRVHGIEHLASVVQPEVSVKVGGSMVIPLILNNPLDHAINVSLSVNAPEGWKVLPVADAQVKPQTPYFLRVRAVAPESKLEGWQHFVVTAQSNGQTIGSVSIRAQLSTGWVAPQ